VATSSFETPAFATLRRAPQDEVDRCRRAGKVGPNGPSNSRRSILSTAGIVTSARAAGRPGPALRYPGWRRP
jgi:hypothetical protein